MSKKIWIAVDIDGTCTENGAVPFRQTTLKRSVMEWLRKAIADPEITILMWSARGQTYVESFCAQYDLAPDLMISKPHVCVDDKPLLRKILHIIGPEDVDSIRRT